MFQLVNTLYSLRIKLHVSAGNENSSSFLCYSLDFNLGILCAVEAASM